MAMRILFPDHRIINIGTPQTDFSGHGDVVPCPSLNGHPIARKNLVRIELQVIFYNSRCVPASFEPSRIGL